MTAAHQFADHVSVEASAERIRHYRYVEERMMRMLGGWIALTPELPAKLLLGRHVWDCAQHADLWGKRLPELRSSPQQSEPPGSDFVRLVEAIETPDGFRQTPERLVGVYRVLKPCLLAAYERHLGEASPVYEPPTRRILTRCIDEERRHIGDGEAILDRFASSGEPAARAQEWEGRLRDLLFQTSGVAGDGMVVLAVPPAPAALPDSSRELVDLERPLGKWPIPEELARAADDHGRAILARDLEVLARQAAGEARDAVVSLYRELCRLDVRDVTLVACARVGGQWLIKHRLTGVDGAGVVQARWVLAGREWQVAEAELVRREAAR